MNLTVSISIIIFILGIISGILTILSSPINSLLYLVFCFINSSIIIILLGLNYIGLTIIIIYAVAISLLFIFYIMMMDIGSTSEALTNVSSSKRNGVGNDKRTKSNQFKRSDDHKIILSSMGANFKSINKSYDTREPFIMITLVEGESMLQELLNGISNLVLVEAKDEHWYNVILNLCNRAMESRLDYGILPYEYINTPLLDSSVVNSVGYLLYTEYLIYLLIISLILLMVMIAVIGMVN